MAIYNYVQRNTNTNKRERKMKTSTDVKWSRVERDGKVSGEVQFRGWEKYIDGFKEDENKIKSEIGLLTDENIYKYLKNKKINDLKKLYKNLMFTVSALSIFVILPTSKSSKVTLFQGFEPIKLIVGLEEHLVDNYQYFRLKTKDYPNLTDSFSGLMAGSYAVVNHLFDNFGLQIDKGVLIHPHE